ncbi:hypothetical protein [Streptomyces sp. 8ZJF_21]|nr:hypothetical protein [Streptomyces sp. 8ZJF_21]MCD9589878.1 hypothetical protein [Streptomyces sp. 8ZJF_21]
MTPAQVHGVVPARAAFTRTAQAARRRSEALSGVPGGAQPGCPEALSRGA